MLTNLDHASSVRERQEGYKAALHDAEIEFRPHLMTPVNLEGVSFEEATKQGICRLMDLPQPPTAIFAVNDQIALRMLPILTSLGISVPQGNFRWSDSMDGFGGCPEVAT